MKGKIFCIGFNKTGTNSLHTLFQLMGLRSFHGMYSDIVRLHDSAHAIFSLFDCFSDGEMHDFEFLDRNFPASKFILTTRRLDQWLVSRIKHVQRRRGTGRTGWMREEYEANPEEALKKWITRRREYHTQVLDYFSYRADDLLVINVCGSTDSNENQVRRVSAFLGVAAPNLASLPWANRNSDFAVKEEIFQSPSPQELVRKIVSELKLTEAEQCAEV